MVWIDEPDKLYHCFGSAALVIAAFAALRPPLLGRALGKRVELPRPIDQLF
jgi:hypothetical protein